MIRVESSADVVIVGGGVVGSAAAWRLAARGRRVVLLEQFEQGHHRGASHGSSRIYRQAYAGRFYTALAARALPLWRQLEETTGEHLLELTGAVDHGLSSTVLAKARVLGDLGIAHTVLDPAEAERRWPGIRFDSVVLYHPDAGRLHADRSVAALQQAAVQAGADVRHNTSARAIRETPRGVEVASDTDTIAAGQVVLAAGAWTPAVLDATTGASLRLPALRTTQEQPAHFVPLSDARWPSFVHHRGAELVGEGIYGLGSVDGIKIGEHGTGPQVDPDTRSFVADPDGVRRLVDYARAWLPGVDADSARVDTCLYTTTPDSNFVVDRAGALTVAAGFSGHGFKFAPVIGELVADLVEATATGPEPFRSGTRHPVVVS
ncbi:FAD-dependent oxidoreductase [Rhodococcus sp. CH91]|uniref:FAD-dependent oxidoreductase n=1 Tax=Rhodococcus sp. CH91 TaxID=2910256 RepID=UPI001F4B3FBD|nr:FAD-dependent oxidoreductase [Rhodococcus sp. CH91]